MKKMNYLIVDDETFARKQISDILKIINAHCNIEEAATLSESKTSISQTQFSIIFLDINLKGESGFDLVPFVPKNTKIVFISAMDSYAIRAFEVNAMDYILKPPTVERVKKAIDLLTDSPMEKKEAIPFSIKDRMFVQIGDTIQFINISDICCIEAKDVYTQLHTSEFKPILIRKPLSDWVALLPDDFIQIHRSTIVNVNVIHKMESHGKGTFTVRLKGIESPFAVSRNYSVNIKKLMIS